MNFDFGGVGSGTVSFSAYALGAWYDTTWVAKSGSGTYAFNSTGYLSNSTYKYRAQLKYGSTIIYGAEVPFQTQ
jgi:hypothetical protein